MEDYTITKKLAQGGQGSTMIASEKRGKRRVVVIKQVSCDSIKSGNTALQECKVLQSLDHDNIVRYFDFFLHQSGENKELQVCTVMEYCGRGDLGAHMNNLKMDGKSMDERTITRWCGHMLSAVAHLHDNRIIHRDVKPLNVFLTDDWKVKMGDFGMASSLGGNRKKNNTQVGTPCYLAPEVLQHEEYGPAIDVWGIGCILYEMLSLDFLWDRKGLISLQVLTRPLTTFDLPQNTSLPLRKLCIEMLSKDAASRPSPHRAARALGAPPPPPPAAGSSPNKGTAASPPNRGHAVPTPSPQREARSPGGPAGTDKYAGKIADFRRKTPAGMAASRGPGGVVEREKKEVEYHRLESAVDWKPTARRRAGTQADVAAALKTAGVGRYASAFEREELYGDLVGEVTEEMLGEMGVDRRDVATVMRAMKQLAVGAKITPGAERDREREKEKEKEREREREREKERERERERERRREREREREREKEREKDRARGRGIDNARRPTAAPSQPKTAAGQWLKDNGFGNHVEALEANGVSELIHLSGLTREVLEAIGVHERSMGTDDEISVLLDAIRTLRQQLHAQRAAAAAPLSPPKTPKRQGSGIGGGGRGGGRLDEPSSNEEEYEMMKEAIKASLEASPSGSASRTGSSQPGSRDPRSPPASGSGPSSSSRDPRSPPASGSSQPGSFNQRNAAGPGSGGGFTRGGSGSTGGCVVLREVVEVAVKDSTSWKDAYCIFEGGSVRLFYGGWDPEAHPDVERPLQGTCVDTWAGRSRSLFIRRSAQKASDDDMLIAFRTDESFVVWLQKLQMAAYFSAKPPPISPLHRQSSAPAAASGRGGGGGGGGGGEGGGEGGGSFASRKVTGVVLRKLELVNASQLFQGMHIAINMGLPDGTLISGGGAGSVLELGDPDDRKAMLFDLYSEVGYVPPQHAGEAGIFFEVRHRKKTRVMPTKYWAYLPPSTAALGAHSLQVWKAPVEYVVARQKFLPKVGSTLHITLTA